MPDAGVEMMEVLVRQHTMPTPNLRSSESMFGDGERREVLEFVDVDVERAPLCLADVGAAIGGKAKGGHKQSAKERRTVFVAATRSTKAPCGSMSAQPCPAAMSCRMSVSSSVVLPVPVLPMT